MSQFYMYVSYKNLLRSVLGGHHSHVQLSSINKACLLLHYDCMHIHTQLHTLLRVNPVPQLVACNVDRASAPLLSQGSFSQLL